MNERTDDNYISLEDAAEYLNIKPVTLRKWIKQKEGLPAHQIGRLWKFKRSELDEWVNSGKSAIRLRETRQRYAEKEYIGNK